MFQLAFLMVLAGSAPTGDVFVDVEFDEAMKRASEAKKVVFVDFFTTWCAPCKKLDAVTWADEAVQAWLTEATVPLKIDAEKQRDLAQRYDVGAFPTLIFLQADGTELDRLVGYLEPEEFLEKARSIASGETVVDGLLRRYKASGATDVDLRMELGRALAQRGRHAEALEHFLWLYDEGTQHTTGFSGVRNSYLVSDIARLGRKHPVALEELRKRRDARVAAVAAGKADYQETLDLAALSRTLKEPHVTLEVYESLSGHAMYDAATAKRLRRAMYREVVDQLLKERRYAEMLTDMEDPESAIERELEGLEHRKALVEKESFPEGYDPTVYMLQSFLSSGAKTYEALLGTEQLATARAVRERLLEVDASYSTYKSLVRHAVRAQVPEEAQDLLARARPTVTEKEWKRLERESRRKPR